MTKIIGISGRKQSGKNTVANYINGDILKNMSMIEDFVIDTDGLLKVKTNDTHGNNGWGILDLLRKDETFISYAERELWPYVKIYHFADPLKELCVDLFGLNPQNIYGLDQDKNQLTPFSWNDMPGTIRNPDIDYNIKMTHREFLEYFGTKIVRAIKQDVWSAYTLNKVKTQHSQLALIPDVRFSNEVEAIHDAGGVVIRLTRNLWNSNATAEIALYQYYKFDLIIDNSNCTIEELCSKLNDIKSTWSI